MQPLNYHHLLYFYKVSKLGSIARASAELQLTQPTISEQIRLLEKSLGHPLFNRVGRSLVLTEAGKTAFAHAEKIFALGNDLTRAIAHADTPPLRIAVDPRLSSRLIASLLPESPFEAVPPSELNVEVLLTPEKGAQHHEILECGTVLLSRRKQSLKQAKLLLPPEPASSSLQAWLKKNKLSPAIAATFHSEDLLLAYAERSDACFAFPDHKPALPPGFHVLARARDLRYRVFAATSDRRPTHPALAKFLALKR